MKNDSKEQKGNIHFNEHHKMQSKAQLAPMSLKKIGERMRKVKTHKKANVKSCKEWIK
jgi:hypothetical protein